MKPEPLDAYQAAYDALGDTPVAGDPEFRSAVARQVVDAVKDLRAERGLAWLRKIGNSNLYYNEAVAVAQRHGGNPDLMTGRMALWRTFEAVAQTFVKAYGRKT